MIGDNPKRVIELRPGRSTTGYAVLLVDSRRSGAAPAGNLMPGEFTFLEAFFDYDETQEYASELQKHFKKIAVPRTEQFRISIDADGKVTIVFSNLPELSIDSNEIIASMGSFYFERIQFPLLAMVSLEDVVSPSEVTHELYCMNATESDISVSSEADFFTTVDEDTGDGIYHGPKSVTVTLGEGDCAKVGDIAGWEWDSGMGFELTVESNTTGFRLSYDRKSSSGRKVTLPGKLKGVTVKPVGRPIRLGTI